jgi:hypothetical protein
MASVSGLGFAEAWTDRLEETPFEVAGVVSGPGVVHLERASQRSAKDLEDIGSLGA